MKDVFRVNGLWISYAHTACAGGAFILALIVGCLLHFDKIVQNEHFGYPQEWFPSVSAAIGDRYPERSVYQLMIALTSGPRFLLCVVTYVLTYKQDSIIPMVLLVVGILRTFTCGGWTYVTSTDDHDAHDVFMVAYIVLTLPWMVLRAVASPAGSKQRKLRTLVCALFFGTIVPLLYFFVQHKVHQVPGAYTIYAFFEWALVGLDIAFDALTAYDFGGLEITIRDVDGVTAAASNVEVLHSPSKLRNGPPILGFVVSVINYFVSWSVITSIGAMIWYFPLWYMGISGYEAFAFSLAAPLFLLVPLIRQIFTRLPQIAFAGQVIGVGAYKVASPPDRMMWVGIGTGFACIAIAVTFYNAAFSSRSGIITSQTGALVGALLLTTAVRIPGYSNNPIWAIMKPEIGGMNHWGVALGVAGALCAGAMVPDIQPTKQVYTKSNGGLVALGVGAWIFLATSFVGDVSAIPLWVWQGFPLNGPAPVPHGLLVIFAVAGGLSFGLQTRGIATSRMCTIVFSFSIAIFTFFKNWVGFAGGLGVAAYLGAVVPTLFEAAAAHRPGVSFGLGTLVYVLFIFAETWTVAYAFVPGGFLLRERMFVIMFALQICLSSGVWAAAKGTSRVVQSNNSEKNSEKQATEYESLAAAMRKVQKMSKYVLIIVLTLSTVFTYYRLHTRVTPEPLLPESSALTAGIWTIHFGLDNGMWASESRMGDLIRDAELDVVGLLESDTQRTIGSHRDITQRIAEELGFYADYGPGADQHTWGAALLSRFPIVQSRHHLTPSPVGELAPAIHATLDVYGELVDVVVFHSGQEEDPEDRRQQTAYVSKLLGSTGDRPTVLLSYLVTKPLEGNYNTWVSETSGMHDIDPTDDDRWCEYILYKNMRRTGYARISRDSITDTELQVGRFQVLEAPNYSNERIEEHDVPMDLRFPSMFCGDGVHGHRYHVFDEPRYFA